MWRLIQTNVATINYLAAKFHYNFSKACGGPWPEAGYCFFYVEASGHGLEIRTQDNIYKICDSI